MATYLKFHKSGRKILRLGRIDVKVIKNAQGMHFTGAVGSYNILIAIVKGLLIANDCTLFAEYEGSVKLGWNWCISMFKRIKWVDRKCTISKSSAAPGFITELGFTFCKEIVETVLADNLPHSCTAYHLYRQGSLAFCFDQ